LPHPSIQYNLFLRNIILTSASGTVGKSSSFSMVPSRLMLKKPEVVVDAVEDLVVLAILVCGYDLEERGA